MNKDELMLKLDLMEYYRLNRQLKLISKRLEELNKKIKSSVVGDKEKFSGPLTKQLDAFKATVFIRRPSPKYDEFKLHDLLVHKKLEWCFKLVPDENLVRQAYIEGELTDDDLRAIQIDEQQVQFALSVEKVDEDGV